jgi:transcriptional regulator with XRE-family HTH domain
MADNPVLAQISAAREEAGLTQERLAELFRAATQTTTTLRTVQSWLSGKTEPSVTEYHYLASVINGELRRQGKLDKQLPLMGPYGRSMRPRRSARKVAPTGFGAGHNALGSRLLKLAS